MMSEALMLHGGLRSDVMSTGTKICVYFCLGGRGVCLEMDFSAAVRVLHDG